MAKDFDGRTAVVTGGASGIGAAVCRQLARDGAAVVVADRDGGGAATVAGEIRAAGGTAEPFAIDVAEPERNAALVRFAQARFGALHLAVNNAGIGGAAKRTADYTVEEWRQVIGVSLDGVFYGMKHQIPAIIAAGGGAIVNMASIETLEGVKSLHPVKRLGTSEEVAELTCFLLSSRASYITGSHHLVDGGYTAQ